VGGFTHTNTHTHTHTHTHTTTHTHTRTHTHGLKQQRRPPSQPRSRLPRQVRCGARWCLLCHSHTRSPAPAVQGCVSDTALAVKRLCEALLLQSKSVWVTQLVQFKAFSGSHGEVVVAWFTCCCCRRRRRRCGGGCAHSEIPLSFPFVLRGVNEKKQVQRSQNQFGSSDKKPNWFRSFSCICCLTTPRADVRKSSLSEAALDESDGD
jgi:hypothetical protein